jgi:hypothetical protein
MIVGRILAHKTKILVESIAALFSSPLPPLPIASVGYSPKLVEEEFCELRLLGLLGSSYPRS